MEDGAARKVRRCRGVGFAREGSRRWHERRRHELRAVGVVPLVVVVNSIGAFVLLTLLLCRSMTTTMKRPDNREALGLLLCFGATC